MQTKNFMKHCKSIQDSIGLCSSYLFIYLLAIGEPAILSSPGVVFAIKNAIASYRGENGDTSYFPASKESFPLY